MNNAKTTVVACLAVTLFEFSRWGLNNLVLPPLISNLPSALEVISITEGLVALILIALVLSQDETKKWIRTVYKLSPLVFVGSLLCCSCGALASQSGLIVVGLILYGVASPWLFVSASSTLIALESKTSLIVLGFGVLMETLMTVLFSEFSFNIVSASILQGIICLVCLWVSRSSLMMAFRALPAGSLTRIMLFENPRSFLPASNPVFVSIVIAGIVRGIALVYSQGQGMVLQTPFMAAPTLLVLVITLRFCKKNRMFDSLYLGSFVLILAGLCLFQPTLYSAAKGAFVSQLPSLLLASASTCLLVLAFLVSSAIGRRNLVDFFRIVILYAACICFGLLGGSALANGVNALLPNHFEITSWMISLTAVAFACYNVIIMRGFSFDEVISGVKSIDAIQADASLETFEQRCKAISQAFGLTLRESEILRYYARGRNATVVQKELFLSYNTVKTHVKNIYRKTAVHSQQELIDLVDNWELS